MHGCASLGDSTAAVSDVWCQALQEATDCNPGKSRLLVTSSTLIDKTPLRGPPDILQTLSWHQIAIRNNISSISPRVSNRLGSPNVTCRCWCFRYRSRVYWQRSPRWKIRIFMNMSSKHIARFRGIECGLPQLLWPRPGKRCSGWSWQMERCRHG